MPTAKPRLMFSVDPKIAADIATIARVTGVPVSKVVTDAVEGLAPYFRQFVVSLEFVERAKSKAVELGDRYAGDVKRKLEPHVRTIEKATADAAQIVKMVELKRLSAKLPGGFSRAGQSFTWKR